MQASDLSYRFDPAWKLAMLEALGSVSGIVGTYALSAVLDHPHVQVLRHLTSWCMFFFLGPRC